MFDTVLDILLNLWLDPRSHLQAHIEWRSKSEVKRSDNLILRYDLYLSKSLLLCKGVISWYQVAVAVAATSCWLIWNGFVKSLRVRLSEFFGKFIIFIGRFFETYNHKVFEKYKILCTLCSSLLKRFYFTKWWFLLPWKSANRATDLVARSWLENVAQ